MNVEFASGASIFFALALPHTRSSVNASNLLNTAVALGAFAVDAADRPSPSPKNPSISA